MPYTKKRQRSVGKSPYKPRRSNLARNKRRKVSKTSWAFNRAPSGVADSTYVKLKYAQRITLSSTSGAVAENVYRGNSLFDPDLTGTGHQPYFFDQWSTFYGYYTVLGAAVKATYVATGSTVSTCNCRYYLVFDDNSAAYTNASNALSSPYSRSAFSNINGESVRTLGMYINSDKIFGLKKNGVQFDSDYSAAVSANPSFQWFIHVGQQPMDESANNAIFVEVEITYYVKFDGRNSPGES